MNAYNGQVHCLKDGCAWESADIAWTPLEDALDHTRRTGHQTSVEIIISQVETPRAARTTRKRGAAR